MYGSVHEGQKTSKVEEYRTVLEEITDWDDFLLEIPDSPGAGESPSIELKGMPLKRSQFEPGSNIYPPRAAL